MRKVLLTLLLFIFSGFTLAEENKGYFVQNKPDIKTEIKWSLVEYTGPLMREAVINVKAIFKNVGRWDSECLNGFCIAVLREKVPGENKWSILGIRTFKKLKGVESIVISKNIMVKCGDKFPPVLQAFHYRYTYTKDEESQEYYDTNMKNNIDELDLETVQRKLWDKNCKPKIK